MGIAHRHNSKHAPASDFCAVAAWNGPQGFLGFPSPNTQRTPPAPPPHPTPTLALYPFAAGFFSQNLLPRDISIGLFAYHLACIQER